MGFRVRRLRGLAKHQGLDFPPFSIPLSTGMASSRNTLPAGCGVAAWFTVQRGREGTRGTKATAHDLGPCLKKPPYLCLWLAPNSALFPSQLEIASFTSYVFVRLSVHTSVSSGIEASRGHSFLVRHGSPNHLLKRAGPSWMHRRGAECHQGPLSLPSFLSPPCFQPES